MQVKIYTHFQVTSCGKSFAYCPHLLKTSSCSFKRVDKLIFRKSRLNWESRNITFVVSSQGCKEEYVGETGSFVKERIKVIGYTKSSHSIINIVEENLYLCSNGELQMFQLLHIKHENKLFRKAYEDCFIYCFKLLLK